MYASNDVAVEYICNLNFKQVIIKNCTMLIFPADPTECPVVSSQNKAELGQRLGERPKEDYRQGRGKQMILGFFSPPWGGPY